MAGIPVAPAPTVSGSTWALRHSVSLGSCGNSVPELGGNERVPCNTVLVRGPAFVTARLSLRPLGLIDAGPVALMNSDVEVMRFVGGPLTAEASDASVLRSVDQWNAQGYGRFAVLGRATGEFVGWVSLNHGHKLYPDDVEIGWRMRRAFWGQGLASEAAARVLEFALNEALVPRVVALADMDNGASVAVMRRIGMRHLVDTRMDEQVITVYETP